MDFYAQIRCFKTKSYSLKELLATKDHQAEEELELIFR